MFDYTQPEIPTAAQLMDRIFTLGRERDEQEEKAPHCVRCCCRIPCGLVRQVLLELFYLQCVPPANLEGDLAKIDENRHASIYVILFRRGVTGTNL